MAYAYANKPQNRASTIALVAGIHVGIGALLVFGLATTVIPAQKEKPIIGEQFELDPLPPEEIIEPETTTETPPSSRDVFVPDTPFTIPNDRPNVTIDDRILPPAPPVPAPQPRFEPILPPAPPPPKTTPSFDPVAAKPVNAPTTWVTQNDYRTSWIARDYTGEVSYRLSIGASGKVESCSVTRSSGISALDQATCQLIQRRARFEPAQDSQGRATSGTYSSAVRWVLPD